MTPNDLDTLRAIFERANVPFTMSVSERGLRQLTLDVDSAPDDSALQGYNGFAATMTFGLEGELTEVWVGE